MLYNNLKTTKTQGQSCSPNYIQQTDPSGTIEISFMSLAVKICQLFSSMEGQSCKPTKNNRQKKGPWVKKSFVCPHFDTSVLNP